LNYHENLLLLLWEKGNTKEDAAHLIFKKGERLIRWILVA
jgi:hypothetical protein